MNRDQATIIRVNKWSETSLIVTWITENHGLMKTVAKGARRKNSPFFGKLDLFYTAQLCWNQSKSSDLHNTTEVVPIKFRVNLREDYLNTELGAYFCVLIDRMVEPGGKNDGFFDLLNRGLDYLCQQHANLQALLHFERESAKLLGIYTQKIPAHLLLESLLGHLPLNRSRCLKLLEN